MNNALFARFPLALLCLCNWLSCAQLRAEIRWNASFTAHYPSSAEGIDVPFAVQTPPQIAGVESYPLVVVLNGGLRVPPSEKFPYFRAQPSRGGIWGYRSMSTYDAMQVIRHMKQHYPIDADRIYLVGSSAGASGAMHLASCFPDEFAAVMPLIAAGNFYTLVNFTNLPVAFHHGDRDWVSSACNVRVQTQRMQELGCPAFLQEYPGAGHGVPGPHEPLMAWLFEQRRNPVPQRIRHECEAPSLGRSYWLRIEQFMDPHQRAYVEAEFSSGIVAIQPRNVAALSLDLERLGDVTAVRIGETALAPAAQYAWRGGRWEPVAAARVGAVQPYEAGGATLLYQGEPLLIVYGTGGAHAADLRAAAEKLAAYGGPVHAAMPGRFPVVSDQALTAEQQARCNLILIGRPEENSVTRTHWPRLPLRLDDHTLLVADRPPLRLDNQVLGLLHPHPDHSGRLVYILAPFADGAGLARFRASPQDFLAGSAGFDRISQPDLIVQDLQGRVARQMQFSHDWRWLNPSGADVRLAAGFADRAQLAAACMQRMLDKSQADFALWWGPADRGMWGSDFNHLQSFDPASYSLADFRTQHRVSETMLGSVTGAELREIWSRWGTNQELISLPKIELDKLDESATYRLHIPSDLYIKLGQRQQNLTDPRSGPTFAAEELIPLIFPPE